MYYYLFLVQMTESQNNEIKIKCRGYNSAERSWVTLATHMECSYRQGVLRICQYLYKMTSQHMYCSEEKWSHLSFNLMDLVGNIRTLLDMKFNKGRPSSMFWASLLTWSWYNFPPSPPTPSPLLLSSTTGIFVVSVLNLAPPKKIQIIHIKI